MEMYQVQLILVNKFGKFVGKVAEINETALQQLIEMSKTFYTTGGFELTCEDGSYAIFPPSIVQESILIINKIKENEENVQE